MLTALPPRHRIHSPHPGPSANGAAAALAMRHAAQKTDDPDLEQIADDIALRHHFYPAERIC